VDSDFDSVPGSNVDSAGVTVDKVRRAQAVSSVAQAHARKVESRDGGNVSRAAIVAFRTTRQAHLYHV